MVSESSVISRRYEYVTTTISAQIEAELIEGDRRLLSRDKKCQDARSHTSSSPSSSLMSGKSLSSPSLEKSRVMLG